MTNDANATPEPTVTKAEYDALVKKSSDLEESYKSLQRTLANERRRGGSTAQLERRLGAMEALQVSTLETLGKMGVEGVDTKPMVEKYRKDREQADAVTATEGAAAQAIVGALEAAGIPQDQFDGVWETDARFSKARELYSSGKHADAVKETVSALTKPVGKSDADVKAAVDAAVAADRQARAAAVDGGKQTSTAGAFDIEAWKKLPAAERIKDLAKAKEWAARTP